NALRRLLHGDEIVGDMAQVAAVRRHTQILREGSDSIACEFRGKKPACGFSHSLQFAGEGFTSVPRIAPARMAAVSSRISGRATRYARQPPCRFHWRFRTGFGPCARAA